MAWTTPKTYTVGEVLTAATMNTHVRDNLKYVYFLKGRVRGSDAVILGGSGFTAVRNSVGNYTVTFSVAFANAPAIAVSAGWNAAGNSAAISYYSVGTGSFSVSHLNQAWAASDPIEFSFIASDPAV